MPRKVSATATRKNRRSWRGFIRGPTDSLCASRLASLTRWSAARREDFKKERGSEQGSRVVFRFPEFTPDGVHPFFGGVAELAQAGEIDFDETRRPLPDVARRRNGDDAWIRLDYFEPGVMQERGKFKRHIRFAA